MWLNTKCDNSEGNQCVCPRCRFDREYPDSNIMPQEWLEAIYYWEHRTDELRDNMKKRFPDD